MRETTTSPAGRFLARNAFLAALFWSAVMIVAAISAALWERDKTLQLTLDSARSFFQIIVTTRCWNSSHGGVYVPVTSTTRPNPYLKVPNRDIDLGNGMALTLINPAYMTRELSELAARRNNVRFHITALNPVRPANRPRYWEKKALESFSKRDDEYHEWADHGAGKRYFRYMAPLWMEQPCLACHARHGYKAGDLRGGISVTLPATAILRAMQGTMVKLCLAFFSIWLLGILGIYRTHAITRDSFRERQDLIARLQGALGEIKTLKGLVPICASCKKVRDDSGYWEQIEQYVQQRSEAEFTHSICPECVEKLYPGLLEKKRRGQRKDDRGSSSS